jgi:signal transduction histidine kinase
MPDISVLISHTQVPIFTTHEDFVKQSYTYTAFTARNSTYEKDLQTLKNEYKAKFKIVYVQENEDLVEMVHTNPNSIAYVDLPIYLKYLEKGYQIKRQFIFKKVREGYAIILPKNHDWHEPVKEFFGGHHFQAYRQEVVKNYLGAKNMGILWDLSGGQETSILGAEKIAEDKKRLEEALELEKQKNLFANTIISVVVVVSVGIIAVGIFLYRYRIRSRANKILTIKNEEIRQQKAEIEAQRDYIEEKNKEISQALEQIQKQNEQLEELNFTKDKFFSIIAHDLRSPINSLLGFTNLLSNYADSMTTEEVKKISNDLNKSLHNVLQLIEDLLTWARSQMNKVDFKPDKLALNQVLQEELDLALILFQKKEIDLEAQLQADLQAFADADHIKFIFRNLLTNALKFTNRNGKVIAKAYENEKKIYIQVIDNGVGIPQAIQEKMFQLDAIKSTKGTDNEKGTGLGLVLCKEFVRKNGGDIWVESKEGKGSCFTFFLKKYEGD